jgi:RimJ/RimL family protein N-acetyltransferase
MNALRDVFGDVIFTRRLQLRRIRKADLGLLFAWSNDPSAFGDYLTPEQLSAAQLAEQLAGGCFWSG